MRACLALYIIFLIHITACYLILALTYFTNPVQLLSPLCLIMCACLVLYFVNQDLHEKLQLLHIQYFLW